MSILRLSNAARNAAADAVVDLLDGGSGAGLLKIYSGTMPATPDTAISDQVLLATLTFSDPAFAAAATGTAAASTIADDTSADDTGTAAWARLIDSAGAVVMDVDVGTTGTTIILNTTNVVSGAVIRITSATITMPSGV